MAHSERLAAICALYHGETPTLPLLSKATGRTLNGLELAAKREGWSQTKIAVPSKNSFDKVQNLLNRVEHIMDKKLHGGIASKNAVDEMLNLLKLAEKLSGTASVLSQQANQTANRSQANESEGCKAVAETANIQSILKKVDQRIHELAEQRVKALLDEEQGTRAPEFK